MITNIQLLRALAALCVVWYHLNFRLWGDIHTYFQGVALFFVISGFIITFVSQKKEENFLAHRFIRIAPIYWLITLIDIVWLFLTSQRVRIYVMALTCLALFIKYGIRNQKKLVQYLLYFIYALITILLLRSFYITNLTNYYNNYFSINAVIKTFLFLPYRDIKNDLRPIMGTGWTLNYEMFFYLIFGFWMFFHRKTAPILTCIILGALQLFDYYVGCKNDYCIFYAAPYTNYFIFGVIIYYLYKAAIYKNIQITKAIAILFTLASVAFIIFANTILSLRPPAYYNQILYIAPPLVVISALMCHIANLKVADKHWLLLGNASYSIYLTHCLVIETVRPLIVYWHLPPFDKNIISAIVVFILSLLIGIVCYQKIEQPLLQSMRRFIDRKKAIA